jgi:hypothetical protein
MLLRSPLLSSRAGVTIDVSDPARAGAGSSGGPDGRTVVAMAAGTTVTLALVVLLALAYARTRAGLVFTGNLAYGEDGAQHELWARQMWAHGRFPNLLTPEHVGRGWFFSPLEWAYGGLRALTTVPYAVVTAAVALVCTPFVVLGLIRLARRAAIPWPRTTAVLAVFAGGLGPIVAWAHDLGLPGLGSAVVHAAVSASGDATPAAAGIGPYQLLVVVALLGVARGGDGDDRGFRTAGLAFAGLAAVYPFYTPVLAVAFGIVVVSWHRRRGRGATVRALAWTLLPAALPSLYYALLPHVDAEFARFQRLNHQGLLSPKVFLAGFAIGLVAVVLTPLLLRGNPARRLLGVLALVVLVMLWVPQYPWRTHLLHFTPFLFVAAVAGCTALWERAQDGALRRVLLTGALVATAILVLATPYHLWRVADAASRQRPPEYVDRDVADALDWLSRHGGDRTVLAPIGVGPWVAAWGGHHTIVGHYFWTRHYAANRRAVDAAYRGRDPAALIRSYDVRYVVIADRRRMPAWAARLHPAARFGHALVLSV